jgi:ATP-dependent exoDNAse (exonuclease V) beta subunit
MAECEWPLAGLVGQQLVAGRIDRTFVDDAGVRWIIDYKTSSHEGSGRRQFLDNERSRYESQLSLYARLLQLSGEANVSVGLYFPLLDEWLSWEVPSAETGTAFP